MFKPHKIYLCRHGETAWSRDGQHTGVTDLALTDKGCDEARALGKRLGGRPFARVLCSPMQRARQTCELAGYSDQMEINDDLMEWNYGDYEGRTTPDILKEVPGWTVFTHGAPNGENAAQIGKRADRVIAEIAQTEGDVALFAHGHFLRVLGARWIEMPPEGGRHLGLDTAALCILGYGRGAPMLNLWNDTTH